MDVGGGPVLVAWWPAQAKVRAARNRNPSPFGFGPCSSCLPRVSEANGRFIVNGQGIEYGAKHGYYGYVDSDLTSGMAAVEAHFDKRFHINSGYRCPVGNATIPKASPSSAHLRGRGVDFQLLGDTMWTDSYKDSIIEWAADNAGANEGYRYTNRNHVHLGFRVSGK